MIHRIHSAGLTVDPPTKTLCQKLRVLQKVGVVRTLDPPVLAPLPIRIHSESIMIHMTNGGGDGEVKRCRRREMRLSETEGRGAASPPMPGRGNGFAPSHRFRWTARMFQQRKICGAWTSSTRSLEFYWPFTVLSRTTSSPSTSALVLRSSHAIATFTLCGYSSD